MQNNATCDGPDSRSLHCFALAAGPAHSVCNGDINVWHCAPADIGPFVAILQWCCRSYLLKAVSLCCAVLSLYLLQGSYRCLFCSSNHTIVKSRVKLRVVVFRCLQQALLGMTWPGAEYADMIPLELPRTLQSKLHRRNSIRRCSLVPPWDSAKCSAQCSAFF